MERGYFVIEPGPLLQKLHNQRDNQVKCLAYLIRNISKITAVPATTGFEVIPVRYVGDPYPAIGMYHNHSSYPDETVNWTALASEIENELAVFVWETGIERLVELSKSETLTWEDVLRPSNDS